MILLDGARVAKERRAALAERVAGLSYVPLLAVVLVGDDAASHTYVRAKTKTCAQVGILSRDIALPANTSTQILLQCLHSLNADKRVDGILVQLPLPPQIDSEAVTAAIDPRKDVDGFHPENLGALLRGNKGLRPCTPKGILELLEYYDITLEGKDLVIVNRSIIVGKTLALMALQKTRRGNATVTLCHSATKDLAAHCRRADVLVTALGKPESVGEVKEGAVIVDVSMNRVLRDGKSRLTGDVCRDSVQYQAAYLTPVPGGVGPMTIAMLLENTVEAAAVRRESR